LPVIVTSKWQWQVLLGIIRNSTKMVKMIYGLGYLLPRHVLIRELTAIPVQNDNLNSGKQSAMLTKDLLTYSEKYKVTEGKYKEQVGKQRLYFHIWLTKLIPVIKNVSTLTT